MGVVAGQVTSERQVRAAVYEHRVIVTGYLGTSRVLCRNSSVY